MSYTIMFCTDVPFLEGFTSNLTYLGGAAVLLLSWKGRSLNQFYIFTGRYGLSVQHAKVNAVIILLIIGKIDR